MDVSAQTLREVEFREKLRGYHPDDVDEFLERVAAGIEYLQDRLRQAVERAQRAESRAAETVEGDDALKRTLVLAQRTAEMAVREAKQEADRIAASARAEANAIVAQAEDMARRTIEETQGGIRAELTQLETARDRLRSDISALERHLEQERMRLRASLSQALEQVDTTLAPPPPRPAKREVHIPPKRVPKVPPLPEIDPASFASAADELAEAGEPEPLEIDVREHAPAHAEAPAPEPEPAPQVEPEPQPEPEPVAAAPRAVDAGLEVDGLFNDLADDSMAAPPAPATHVTREPEPEAAPAPVWAPPEPVHSDVGADTMAVAATPAPLHDQDLDDDEDDEDPFIAELRRAITDTQPLGPREEGDLNPEATGDALMHGDVLDSSRLGSLLRRRR